MDSSHRAERRAVVLLLSPWAWRVSPLAIVALLACPPGSPGATALQAQEAAPVRAERDVADPERAPLPRTAEAELRDRLERLLADPALERAHAGLVVQDAASGEILFDRAGEKRFTAASVAKLVTSVVALDRLGPDHRWTTRLVGTGPVEEDTLRGDLWLVGGGDPSLTREEVLEWARRIRGAGIRRVAGDVVADDRAFPGGPWGRGWMWEDLLSGWGAGVSALHVSPSRIRAHLFPAREVGGLATLRVGDGEPSPELENRVRTGPPGSEVDLEFLPNLEDGANLSERAALVGWIPADAERVPLSLAPSDPTRHFLHHLAGALARAGVTVAGGFRQARTGEPPAPAVSASDAPGGRDGGSGATFRLEIRSEPLREVLVRVLKRSDNQAAEILLRTLGLELGRAGTAAEGLAVVEATLSDWGISPEAAALADGSGLSRYTEVTPAALVRLLRRARQLPHFGVLREALPVAGEDGTLAGRFLSTAGSGNVRAKTGSLSGVRALAGYVEDAAGDTLVFALLLNGYAAPGDVAAAIEDLLVEQLALYRGPAYP